MQTRKLSNSYVVSLSFADDFLIMSEGKEVLQNSLDELNNFRDDWQLTLNIKKTKTTVIQ